jgi:hypothetical protein
MCQKQRQCADIDWNAVRIIDFEWSSLRLSPSGMTAVARPIQGISPKHCTLPRSLGQGLLAKCQNHQNPCLAAALEKPMSDTVLGLYLSAAFIGGLTSGIAGFALSLVLSGVWLHILPPIQVVTLVVGYGVLMYAYSIWKLRHALSWRKVAPFILGGVGGVPVGVMLLAYIDQRMFAPE